MAGSPKSSWTGTLSLGLLTVPISVAPTSREEREASLKKLCACHGLPVDRSERCKESGKAPDSSVTGVEKSDGGYHVLNQNEIVAIEDTTRSDVLEVAESRPLAELPMSFATGTYFVRPEKGNRAAAQSMAILTEALAETGYGLITKWCSRTVQRPVVIFERNGLLFMSKLPTANELREPGEQETAHQEIEVPAKAKKLAVQLLNQVKPRKAFNLADYENEGLKLRQQMVDRVLAGDVPEAGQEPIKPTGDAPDDLMATLEASVASIKDKE